MLNPSRQQRQRCLHTVQGGGCCRISSASSSTGALGWPGHCTARASPRRKCRLPSWFCCRALLQSRGLQFCSGSAKTPAQRAAPSQRKFETARCCDGMTRKRLQRRQRRLDCGGDGGGGGGGGGGGCCCGCGTVELTDVAEAAAAAGLGPRSRGSVTKQKSWARVLLYEERGWWWWGGGLGGGCKEGDRERRSGNS